jgi:hypothetical protein
MWDAIKEFLRSRVGHIIGGGVAIGAGMTDVYQVAVTPFWEAPVSIGVNVIGLCVGFLAIFIGAVTVTTSE